MLPKKNRADTKMVEKVFKEGKFINSPLLTFKYLINKGFSGPKVSFLAPKTVAKGAVERNTLRRRGYTALAKHIEKLPPDLMGVFIYRKPIKTVSEVEIEIKSILSKV